ncbi:Fur family transcriptional regulator [Bifidobacterium hapali]|uniref:Fur family transcriptional regulator n=1 Tax=Bifidobacterium hapali TaxID=1630172 RepID=A0A261FZR3_9BIFI|nr:Fur family transcriptional regulator [Bifidobacterium hapali]OZG64403.1 Fur family transcriptional regulator [Bifidobacterium hapali]
MTNHDGQQRDERAVQSPNPRITRPRMLIEQTLSELSRFATAQEITDILRNRGTRIGTTTAYRNLQMMASQGKLDVIHLNGETLYRACVDHRHHHHIMCRNCGKTIEIEIPGLEQWIEQAATKLHYVNVAHELEIYGLCPHCARNAVEGTRNGDEQRNR